MEKLNLHKINLIDILVVDCTLADCPTDTCGEEKVECARTCLNGYFGLDRACPLVEKTKSKVCPAVACG